MPRLGEPISCWLGGALALGMHVRLGMRRGATLLQLNAGSGGSAETKSLVRLIQHSPCNGKRYNAE